MCAVARQESRVGILVRVASREFIDADVFQVMRARLPKDFRATMSNALLAKAALLAKSKALSAMRDVRKCIGMPLTHEIIL